MLDGSISPERNYNFDYIQVPILAKIYLSTNFSLDMAPSFNFLVHDEQTYTNINNGEVSFDGNGKSFEFSLGIGATYKFMDNFFGNIRYMRGLTDTFDFELEESNSNVFQIGIGYLFK